MSILSEKEWKGSSEAPRPQGGASRKGSFIHIVPLDPAYKAGLAGHVPAKAIRSIFYKLKTACKTDRAQIFILYNW